MSLMTQDVSKNAGTKSDETKRLIPKLRDCFVHVQPRNVLQTFPQLPKERFAWMAYFKRHLFAVCVFHIYAFDPIAIHIGFRDTVADDRCDGSFAFGSFHDLNSTR